MSQNTATIYLNSKYSFHKEGTKYAINVLFHLCQKINYEGMQYISLLYEVKAAEEEFMKRSVSHRFPGLYVLFCRAIARVVLNHKIKTGVLAEIFFWMEHQVANRGNIASSMLLLSFWCSLCEEVLHRMSDVEFQLPSEARRLAFVHLMHEDANSKYYEELIDLYSSTFDLVMCILPGSDCMHVINESASFSAVVDQKGSETSN